MKESDNIIFYDTSCLSETAGIRQRTNVDLLTHQLAERFASEAIRVISVQVNDSGRYRSLLSRIHGLPAYCAVELEHMTGRHSERIIIWAPLAWNDRFIGTAGGGTSTGGKGTILRPRNTTRGMTLPKAVLNGFTAATTDAGNRTREWALDKQTRQLDWERVENWRSRSTHFMTLIGKAVAEILHQRPALFAYFHGGSGGGRQALVEAQDHPRDYNGVWASCPAINWSKFVLGGLWPIAVMNSAGRILSRHKIKYFTQAAQDSVGGAAVYYQQADKVLFDPQSVVGHLTKDGPITTVDAEMMQQIWDGPRSADGSFLWYGFRPGVKFWKVIIPIGAFYYSLIGFKPKPFLISTYYARWITGDPKQTFNNITKDEFVRLFERSVTEMAGVAADQADLLPFAAAGGKLIIDHGIDDPLIPVDGTIDYFEKLCSAVGGQPVVNQFCRLYITPGDGHGNCSGHGPGITERDGMTALIDWVEQGIAPPALRVIQVDRKGETICEKTQEPFIKPAE